MMPLRSTHHDAAEGMHHDALAPSTKQPLAASRRSPAAVTRPCACCQSPAPSLAVTRSPVVEVIKEDAAQAARLTAVLDDEVLITPLFELGVKLGVVAVADLCAVLGCNASGLSAGRVGFGRKGRKCSSNCRLGGGGWHYAHMQVAALRTGPTCLQVQWKSFISPVTLECAHTNARMHPAWDPPPCRCRGSASCPPLPGSWE